jgi:hypothetical protein
MHFVFVNKFSDFMQVLNSINKPTKNEHFSKHILFSTIYLLQEQKLNYRNYYKLKINMSNFVQATEHNMHTYAKFGDFTFYVFS